MIRIILGTQSPRRRELMGIFSIPFEQVSPVFIEEAIPFNGDPLSYVNSLSRGKSESLHHLYPQAAILTADTVVFYCGKIYNKPLDYDQAFEYLSELQGQWQSVYTSVCLYYDSCIYQEVEETRVLFNPMQPAQIHLYLEHTHWADKAGGYTIQKLGMLLVKKIEGCYYNVLGLPVNAVRTLFLKIGIDLWQYVK
jgi:septum formation protein